MIDLSDIIPAIDRNLIESELKNGRFIRDTNNGNNEIYIVNHHNSPHTVQEIGRLREIAFRLGGGGTGTSCDLDDHDTNEVCYEQLIVWNPQDKEIVGGYRFILCKKALFPNELPRLSTTSLFEFSKNFIDNFLPHTIELGRSFIQPKYQPSVENRKGLFSLDNLWDGLGALVVDHPEIKYFFGKVTMYPDFHRVGRDMILHFMNHYFPDPDQLLRPHDNINLPIKHDMSAFEAELKGQNYKEGHKILNAHIRSFGENIPPLVNSYMNLSATMRTFGTALNDHFGEVEETGIMVTIADIYDSKKERHVSTYLKC